MSLKNIFLLFTITLLSFLNVYSQTHIWIGNGTSTDWSNATNWNVGTVPDITSTVLIPSGFEVTILTETAFADAISLNNASLLTIKNNLSLVTGIENPINGVLVWNQGAISGGVIENDGEIRVENLVTKDLINVTVNNRNRFIFFDSRFIELSNGSIINNFENGIMDLFADGGFTQPSGTGATLNNFGLIKKSTPAGNGFIYMETDTNNFGIIEIEEGGQYLFFDTIFHNMEEGILRGVGIFSLNSLPHNFINDGTISPAGNQEIGNLLFSNNFTTSALSVLSIDLNSDENDTIMIDATNVALQGKIEVNIENIQGFEVGQQYTILTASEIESCDFDPQVTSNNIGNGDVTFNIICDGNVVILEVDSVLLTIEDFVIHNNPFSVIPNPANHTKNVSIEISENIKNYTQLSIEVYNTLGKNVLSVPDLFLAKNQFSISSLKQGLYFVNLKTDNKSLGVQKLIIK